MFLLSLYRAAVSALLSLVVLLIMLRETVLLNEKHVKLHVVHVLLFEQIKKEGRKEIQNIELESGCQ